MGNLKLIKKIKMGVVSTLCCVALLMGNDSLTYASTTTSPYTGVTYTHRTMSSGTKIVHGIDVSQWQGDINWKKVKEDGIKYVFIRAGFRASATGVLTADYNYEQNIEGAIDAGLKVGIYIFSQATSTAKAKEEAKYLISKAKGYDVTMPLIMDFEYNGSECILAKANLTNKQRTNICDTFLSYVKDSGYTPLLYANFSMLSDDLNSASLSNKYKIWIARYNTETGYSGDYDFWQYSDRGSVSGISGNVDMNFWYNDGSLNVDSVDAKGVYISSENETIAAGKSVKLTAQMMPEDTTETYRWTSTNPQVAYVSADGKVTGVSKGKTVIKVTTSSGLTARCKVVVNKNIKDYKVVLSNEEAKYTYTGTTVKPKYTVRSKAQIATRGKAKEAVYVRTGPSLEYTAVECLKKGKKVYVYGFKKVDGVKWYAVKCKISGSWCKGYVCGRYLKITSKKYDKLTKNTDFTGKYVDNTEIGVARIRLTGLGNVSGTKTKKFTIGPKKVNDITVNNKNSSFIEFAFSAENGIDGYVLYKASSKDGTYKKCKTINTDGEEIVEEITDETSETNEELSADTTNLDSIADETNVEYKAAGEVDDTNASEENEVVSTVCKDTGVKKGHEYYYKVYSYRYVNGEMITSRASKVVTANCKFAKKVYAKVKTISNIRKGAGVKYKTLKTAAKNSKYRVLAITHDSKGKAWVKIRYTNNAGKKKTGYILKSLVKLS